MNEDDIENVDTGVEDTSATTVDSTEINEESVSTDASTESIEGSETVVTEYSEEQLFDMSEEDMEAAYHAAVQARDNNIDAENPDEDGADTVESEVNTEDKIEENEEEDTEEENAEDDLDAEDDLEQLDTDSDDDDAENDDEEDDDNKNTEESDVATEEDKVQSDDKKSDESDKKQEDVTYKLKAIGGELDLTIEELKTLASKGLDYTRKTQDIKPFREMISAIEAQEVDINELNLMIDALKGKDAGAMAEILKRTGVDPLDLNIDDAKDYEPKNYGQNETELNIKDVIRPIQNDQEYSITQNIVDEEWDAGSRAEIRKDPKIIGLLHDDVKSGIYKEVAPLAKKLQVLDNGPEKSSLEYYKMAGREYYRKMKLAQENNNSKNVDVDADTKAEAKIKAEKEAAKIKADAEAKVIADAKKKVAKQKKAKYDSERRKAAATTNSLAGKKSVTNYLDASDDDQYQKWLDKMDEE